MISARHQVFPNVPISYYFFHLFRAYINELVFRKYTAGPMTMKEFFHSMLTLAFVPIADVLVTFGTLQGVCPASLIVVMEYFEFTYIRGRLAQG